MKMTEAAMGQVILMVFGGIFLLFFVYLTRKNILFLKTAVKTKGRIADIALVDSLKKLYTTVVEFTTPSGEKVLFSPKTSSSKSAYRVGQEVAVLYDPDLPEDAKIKSFFQLWFPAIILFLLAALILGLGFYTFFVQAPPNISSSIPQENKGITASEDPLQYLLLYWVLPGGFILFGAIMLLMGIKTLFKMIASLYWPKAKGTVLESEVGTSGKFYSPTIRYEFTVNRKKYESYNYDLAKLESGDPLPSQRAVKRYPAGKEVVVHYNPKNPEDCALEPGIRLGGLLLFFAGGAAFLFFAWIAMVAVSQGWLK
jgi:hypothetical protein